MTYAPQPDWIPPPHFFFFVRLDEMEIDETYYLLIKDKDKTKGKKQNKKYMSIYLLFVCVWFSAGGTHTHTRTECGAGFD